MSSLTLHVFDTQHNLNVDDYDLVVQSDFDYDISGLAKDSSILFVYPERTSHPERAVARANYIAKLVNLGYNVHVLTNSDYMVNQFNICIMLSGYKEHQHIQDIIDSDNIDKRSILDPKIVALISHENGETEHTGATKYGIKIRSFDKLIRSMNKLQDRILYGEV